MSKTVLMILGIVIALMGISGLISSMNFANMPVWLAIVELIVGIIAIGVSAMDKQA